MSDITSQKLFERVIILILLGGLCDSFVQFNVVPVFDFDSGITTIILTLSIVSPQIGSKIAM